MKQNITYRWMVWASLLLCFVWIAAGCGSPASDAGGSPSTGQPADNGGPIHLKVASNNTQTSWYMFTAALAEVLKNNGSNINLEVLPFAGGIGNIELVAQKEADFAVSFNIANKWASDGVVAYDKKYPDIRALVGGINQYYVGIIARTDFLKEHGIDSIADIKEKKIPVRIITNPVGSLAEYNTRMVLDAYGLDYDTVKSFGGSVELTSNDVIKTAFQNGTADLHVLAMSKAHPVITEIALQTDIAVMGIEDEVREWFKQYGYKNIGFPGGQFKGQEQEVDTVGFVVSYITHKDMDEELVYQLTKAVNENKEALVNGHKSVNDFDPQEAANPELLGVPLHPGAERYYREAGILKE
ncbi:TAXI family TRAP transporter solute-binding subunit [Brevibacillus humidisoli]|uniref:TAXI family TRAP transporter solute-binding subunit n=1 Tax=Brevibacillus humidisoli TaxID=2895522 RepID=UPI001E420B7A|nr:TAXI family TRAP transporter solute-binding subunit [Brevibacillus humidisoli]UFJ42000.1 TAXI family TRAP transporter solute-binding subunit [Brevibacillus humidisoli]